MSALRDHAGCVSVSATFPPLVEAADCALVLPAETSMTRAASVRRVARSIDFILRPPSNERCKCRSLDFARDDSQWSSRASEAGRGICTSLSTALEWSVRMTTLTPLTLTPSMLGGASGREVVEQVGAGRAPVGEMARTCVAAARAHAHRREVGAIGAAVAQVADHVVL